MIKDILRKIEIEYGFENGELDRFNSEHEEYPIDLLSMDSIIGGYGLTSSLGDIVNSIKDPIKRDLLKSFISETTERLSEEDLDALTDMVWGTVFEKYCTIIMTYDDFVVFKDAQGSLYVKDTKTRLIGPVKEVGRISWSENYGDMSDGELISKFSCDISGELDDCSAYVYYDIIEDTKND